MTRLVLLLFALIVAFLAGALGGSWGRRALESADLPPRRRRPAGVEAALRAWEARGERPTEKAPDGDPESAADIAFLHASVTGDESALLDMARRHDGRDASARALWRLVEHAPDAPTRERRRQAFAARWPDAWVLVQARRSP